jgi:hypothetical protein
LRNRAGDFTDLAGARRTEKTVGDPERLRHGLGVRRLAAPQERRGDHDGDRCGKGEEGRCGEDKEGRHGENKDGHRGEECGGRRGKGRGE